MLEAGYPDFVFDTYTALMAPARAPQGDRRPSREAMSRDPAPARDGRQAAAVGLRGDGQGRQDPHGPRRPGSGAVPQHHRASGEVVVAAGSGRFPQISRSTISEAAVQQRTATGSSQSNMTLPISIVGPHSPRRASGNSVH